jgi:hypothetical protein
MIKISYSGCHVPPEIIQHAIWLYLRFTLSFRDLKDLLAERATCWGERPRRHRCAKMKSLQISNKGDRPWNRLAELAWTRRNIICGPA